MSEITIKTNRQWRDPIYWWDLTDEERKEFDYLTECEGEERQFFKYKGQVYDSHEFMVTDGLPEFNPLRQWCGYHGDSFFSGIVVRWSECGDQYQIGTYTS